MTKRDTHAFQMADVEAQAEETIRMVRKRGDAALAEFIGNITGSGCNPLPFRAHFADGTKRDLLAADIREARLEAAALVREHGTVLKIKRLRREFPQGSQS